MRCSLDTSSPAESQSLLPGSFGSGGLLSIFLTTTQSTSSPEASYPPFSSTLQKPSSYPVSRWTRDGVGITTMSKLARASPNTRTFSAASTQAARSTTPIATSGPSVECRTLEACHLLAKASPSGKVKLSPIVNPTLNFGNRIGYTNSRTLSRCLQKHLVWLH
ncbi:hypothetical protein AOL_s00083g455 [Orbilia oligospora ATCC 24927]|uniref:Uncharacterized protein n=1 Tax=Arthrobotrys oligospora (strain ATCC 24927 / CBS 115.81 / DSM 1491) TaxID=756982 RepID=G1XHH4_ARTOA|nr:hypothetical protein AOL_s00083g455 [Orbilia oligospora ATCC 24927]EGX47362.1 hypothetical protein AOL_s00083g455 [Orbilia oligospora ATCC 24927]